MKKIKLKDLFDTLHYDWQKDAKSIETICRYTKTRVNKNVTEFQFSYGMEQTFLLKALAEHFKTKHFFEIGTGRGTACYALSLAETVEKIHTVDILQFDQKFSTAIDFKPATVSLYDIYKKIPFKQKSKIAFHHRKELSKLKEKFGGFFDLCFIDGDHTNKSVILEDYEACKKVLADGGVILWDDYDAQQFAVKGIVDDLLKDPNLNGVLVENRGHLFTGDKPAEVDGGLLIMSKGEVL